MNSQRTRPGHSSLRGIPASGTSMLPTLYPRDLLWVRDALPTDLVPGAIVAYPSHSHVVCHRIVDSELRADGRWFAIRGDAQRAVEWVEEKAIVWTVVRVEGRLGAWNVDSRRGLWLRELALARRPGATYVRLAAARLLRGMAAARRAVYRG